MGAVGISAERKLLCPDECYDDMGGSGVQTVSYGSCCTVAALTGGDL